jgi:hypothetical protein
MTAKTGLGLTYPLSSDHTRLWEHIQQLATDADFLLDVPDPASDASTGSNTLVSAASTWATLPTNNVSVAMTNPHTSKGLLTQVSYGARLWTDQVGVRACIVATGGLTIVAGIGAGGAASWGEILASASINGAAGVFQYNQQHSLFTVVLPANTTTTFTMQGMRETTTGTAQINYPTLRVTPLRYV